MDRPLLIVTIYGPSVHNAEWYALQRRFVAGTTNVDHVYGVFLNGVDSRGFDASHILGASKTNKGHADALGEVLRYFKANAFATYLILDSDCFPVRRGWHDILIRQMQRFDKEIAAPVRTENLDLFPHPSAVFMLRAALDRDWLDFSDGRPATNLLGQQTPDVGSAMRDLGALLPLLRTNVVNMHPVAAAVYHHLFYHHGAGSREFTFRILTKFRLYEHWYDSGRETEYQDELLAALFRDPDRFIGTLLGSDQTFLRGRLRPDA